ncbi:hypothetical protein KTE26_19325 [Ralstonia mannitolilytica]|uniref:hypothetical protein n=1 Tax=Ralstonia mannitolilytica TaxID=105219 RepID=UPI000CEEF9B7|nr:hypothetical protein [Ralstonia mannitolilytica]MBU9580592.1 hypothetical protein [Ralstonia mannitolilytica]
MSVDTKLICSNLLFVLAEIGAQPEVGARFPPELLDYPEQVEQIREWIEDAGEFGLAYESIVRMLEQFPFRLSGQAAIKLLEVGLKMRFKTDQTRDASFDSR